MNALTGFVFDLGERQARGPAPPQDGGVLEGVERTSRTQGHSSADGL
jgi:hypothetical protein